MTRRSRLAAVLAASLVFVPALAAQDPMPPFEGFRIVERLDIDRNPHVVCAIAQDDAVDRRDIGIVAADRDDDMVVRHPDAVGGVEPDPPALRPAP